MAQAEAIATAQLLSTPDDSGQTQPSDTSSTTPVTSLPPAGPGDQFAPETLSGLLSVQQQPDSSTTGAVGPQGPQKPHHHHHHGGGGQASATSGASATNSDPFAALDAAQNATSGDATTQTS